MQSVDTRALSIGRGLHVLRYVASSARAEAPSVQLAFEQPKSGMLLLVPAPGKGDDVLERPGDTLVVVAETDATLLVRVVPRRAGGSIDAQLQLELLSSGSQPTDRVRGSAWKKTADRTGESFACDLTGHVARRGDVTVTAGDWLAGPEAPAPIEGILIDVEPASIDLQYQILVQDARGRWSSWVKSGEFAGTRGRALPIVGVRLKLADDRSGRLHAQALFLGSAIARQSGSEVEFVSPAADPLVGLSISIERLSRTDMQQRSDTGRVRIFRASSQSVNERA